MERAWTYGDPAGTQAASRPDDLPGDARRGELHMDTPSALPPAAWVLAAVVLVGLGVVALLLVPAPAGVALAALGAGSALVVLGVAARAATSGLPAVVRAPLAAGGLLLLATHAAAWLLATRQPGLTGVLALTLVTAGWLLGDSRWFPGVAAGVVLSWLAAMSALAATTGLAGGAWGSATVVLVLGAAAGGAARVARRRTLAALLAAEEAVRATAVTDPLTGLANHRGLALVGAQIVETARRQGDAVHCVLLAVEGLRELHAAGGRGARDEVVLVVAEVLRSATRATDVVARWSGDEFVVVGPGPGGGAAELERRVRDRLAGAPAGAPECWTGTVLAAGAVLAPWDAGTLSTLLDSADEAIYARQSLRAAARRADAPGPGADD